MKSKLWQVQEVSLTSKNTYSDPYQEVDVWIDLKGPDSSRRVYGFWDGGNLFKVRYLADSPGKWAWSSGSNQDDSGLNGSRGSLVAEDWSESEKQQNRCRRGFIRNTANKHAFEHADGTPIYLLADTWWATPTFRYRWDDAETERDPGPEMGFKDMVKYRKKQGFNCIGMIAALPHWDNDGLPFILQQRIDGKLLSIREAWQQAGTESGKAMHNEGGRPFEFPGKVPGLESVVPDFDRINPAYFQHLDKKIAYLNEQGFYAFIESARRDVSIIWRHYHNWKESYARYLMYLFNRYQAHGCLFSPIHYDYFGHGIPAKDYIEPIHHWIDQFGAPPFGTPVSNNASPSTLVNFGPPSQARWLSFHQIGNMRDHDNYWYLTDIFFNEEPLPALNGEPYYPGYPDNDPPADSSEAESNCRSGMYGSFLSGGLAGYFYGCEGLWGGDIEPQATYRMWESLTFESGRQVGFLNRFVFVEGKRYQELIPQKDLLSPNSSGSHLGYQGWSYCASTKNKDFLLLYFERDCPQPIIRNLQAGKIYEVRWFDPRQGKWIEDGTVPAIVVQQDGRAALPGRPNSSDWGMKLKVLE